MILGQQELYPLYLHIRRFGAKHLFKINFYEIIMVRPDNIIEMLFLNMDKGYVHQVWEAETAREVN